MENNPMIQRRFMRPVPAPYIPEVNILGAGAKTIPLGTQSESEYFELVYDDAILQNYVTQTNLKVSKQPALQRAWDNNTLLTIEELKKYFATDLYMDIVVREGDVKGYWSKNMWGDDFVKSLFNRKRFLAIRSNLTWMDTTDINPAERAQRNAADGFWTITGLFEEVTKKFKQYYIPTSKLSIDEITVFFKGRHRCRCYNPSKPNKWHFKIYALCDAKNGYVYDWFLYRGKDERRPPEFSASEYPIEKLTSENPLLHHKDYLLSVDNWFTSCRIAQRLTERRGIGFVGTIRTNRAGFPRVAVFPKTGAGVRPRGTISSMRNTINGNDYYITSWQDNKPVHMLSTFKPKRITVRRMMKGPGGVWAEQDIPCPTTIPIYNEAMKGCDVSDQNTAYYDARRRVQSRWQPRLDRRVFKTAVVNANILRNSGKDEEHQSSLLDFIKGLIVQWAGAELPLEEAAGEEEEENAAMEGPLENDAAPNLKRRRTLQTWERNVRQRTTGSHFPEVMKSERLANGGYSNPRSNCMLCKRMVNSVCQTCGVHLCLKSGNGVDCFRAFHTRNKLRVNRPGNN
jgi:hypothetical protein